MRNWLGLAFLLAGVLLAVSPTHAGDELGISDAGSVFATALATLGIVMAIGGLAIGGFLMATNFFLALTVGGSLLVGGTFMALSEDIGGALWGADLGGGNVADYRPAPDATAEPTACHVVGEPIATSRRPAAADAELKARLVASFQRRAD